MSGQAPPGTEQASLQRELLDTLLEHSSEALIVVDDAGTIVYGSPGAGLVMGISPTVALGTGVFDYLHPDDLELAAEMFDRRGSYGGRDTGWEVRVRDGAGNWLRMVVWASVIDAPGWGASVLTLRLAGDQPSVERSLRSHLAAAEAISHLTGAFIDATTADDILHEINSGLDSIAALTRSQAASVWLEREEKGAMEQVAYWPLVSTDLGAQGPATVEPAVEELLSRSQATQNPSDISDATMGLAWAQGATALLSEPFSTGRRRGVVVLTRVASGPEWVGADTALTASFAKLLGRVFRASQSEALLRHMYRDGTQGVVIHTGDGTLIDCNDQYLDMIGLTREQAQRTSLSGMVHPDDIGEFVREITKLRGAKIDRMLHEVRVLRPSGDEIRIGVDSVRFQEAGGMESFVLSTLDDVTVAHQQRHDLELEQQRLERLIQNVPAVILRVQRDSTVLLCGPEIERISQLRCDELTGARLLEFITDEDLRRHWAEGLALVFDHGATLNEELRVPTVDKEYVLDARVVPEHGPDGAIETALIVAMDITERRDIADQLRHAATHDSLTGLANRQAMLDRIDHLRSRNDVTPALIMIDLDRFKLVNDSLGHSGGDEVLRITGQRIGQEVRPMDVVARLGGDEFAVVLPDIGLPDLERLAERLRTAIERPFLVGGHQVPQTISLGIAPGEPGLDATELMVRADRALYAAKAKGRNRLVVFEDSLLDEVETRLLLERELRHAIDHNELEVHFQPEFALSDRSIVGAEALLRWRHPTRGLVAADQFIDVAEASGLVVEMGRIALRTACFGFAHICDTVGRDDLTLRVNISAREFARNELPELVATALRQSNFPAERLCLEMTETTLMDSPEIALGTFGRLHRLGVQFAIDDFGTGYSSLTYLKRFPVDAVKIDRSFVEDVTTNAESRAIVDSIVGLANALDLQVVAEGIETEEQAELIRSIGCERGQGHLVARALPPSEFVRLPGLVPGYAHSGTRAHSSVG